MTNRHKCFCGILLTNDNIHEPAKGGVFCRGCRTALTKTLGGPGGLRIVLDRTQVFPDDPGCGTPAMVYLPFGKGSATYWCASDTGECDDAPLTERQVEWLHDQGAEVDAFLNAVNVP